MAGFRAKMRKMFKGSQQEEQQRARIENPEQLDWQHTGTRKSVLGQMQEELRNSEKGGLKKGANSEKFEAVDRNLEKVLGLLQQELSERSEEGVKDLYSIIHAYSDLLTACGVYLGRMAMTSEGRERQRIVKYIQNYAEIEIKGFLFYADQYPGMPEGERAKTGTEVLEKVRMRNLELAEGKTEAGLKHVGGAASSLAVLAEGDLKDGKTTGYFKEEDIFTNLDERGLALRALEKVREKMPIDDSDFEEIKKIMSETDNVSETNNSDSLVQFMGNVEKKLPDKYKKNRQYHEFIDAVAKVCSSNNEVRNKTIAGGATVEMFLSAGESVNMSNRNVAASRIAHLFGVGDLIAQSETAVLKDQNGFEKKGNLMQEARGIEASDAITELQRAKFEEMRKNTKYTNFSSMKNNIDSENITTAMTPEFIKSLTSLQVLDNLMGQVDRHAHNYMVEMTKGKLGRVQGIDNDFSFGHTAKFELKEKAYRSIFKKGVDQDKENAELVLPYMDKALADRILAVEESEVRLILMDVLEQKAIDAFCERLKIVQEAIQKDRKENPNSGRYLEKDEDWANKSVIEAFEEKGKQLHEVTTYVGFFVATGRIAGGCNEEEKENVVKAFWLLAEKAGKLKNKEEEEKFLGEECEVDKDTVEYLKDTGQLDGNPQILKKYPKIAEKIYGVVNRELLQKHEGNKHYSEIFADLEKSGWGV